MVIPQLHNISKSPVTIGVLGYNKKLKLKIFRPTFFGVGRNTEQIKGTYADAFASKKRWALSLTNLTIRS